MSEIQHTLAIARALKKTYPAASYYKYLDAIHDTLDLLGGESFLRSSSGLSRRAIERLFGICNDALNRAGEQLDAVLELSEKDARTASEQSVLNAEPTIEAQPSSDINVRRAEMFQDVGKMNEEPMVKTKEAGNEEFGDEPELAKLHDAADLPLIPVSSICLAILGEMYAIQLLLQRLELLASATPKQRSNAIYLDNLHQIVAHLQNHALKKLDLQSALRDSMDMRVGGIPPGDLARQITRLQMPLFKRVPVGELDVPIRDRASLAPNLHDFANLSLYLTHWCQYEILRYASEDNRANVMSHLIRTAIALSDLANYEGCRALTIGLKALPIENLRSTYQLVPKRLQNSLESLSILVSGKRSYAQLREITKRRATPCIPAIVVPGRWEEFQGSEYENMFSEQPKVQHYLLNQPFRWEEDLYTLAVVREPRRALGGTNEEPKLTKEEEASLSYGDGDVYEIIERNIRGSLDLEHSAQTIQTPRSEASTRSGWSGWSTPSLR